jgi:hypothetical protein
LQEFQSQNAEHGKVAAFILCFKLRAPGLAHITNAKKAAGMADGAEGALQMLKDNCQPLMIDNKAH